MFKTVLEEPSPSARRRGVRRLILAVRNVSRLPAGSEDKGVKMSTPNLHPSLYNC